MNTENRGFYTGQEIQSQPEVWEAAVDVLHQQQDAIQAVIRKGQYSQVIFTGCGSTYYLSLAAAALLQELTGVAARGVPASELWLNPRVVVPSSGRVLLVAVSRSGETTETLQACEAFRFAGRGELVTLSCYGDMPLAHLGHLNIVFPAGQEESMAQTRSFSSLYVGTVGLAGLWSERLDLFSQLSELAHIERRVLDEAQPLARQYGQDTSLDRFYFLGSGPRYGLACELSLKMKEMSLSQSEPFHFLEFRHGPKSMVNGSTLMIGLVSEKNRTQEMAVLDEMRTLGGRVLAISQSGGDVNFASSLEEAVTTPLYLAAGQLLAYERAMAKGLNPDRPANLDTVVRLH